MAKLNCALCIRSYNLCRRGHSKLPQRPFSRIVPLGSEQSTIMQRNSDINTNQAPRATKPKSSHLVNGANGGTIRGCNDANQLTGAHGWKDTVGMREGEETFLRNFFELVLAEGISKPLSAECKVIDFQHPHELKNQMDLTIKDEPESHDRLLQLCKQTYDHSVKVSHPQFYNQLFAGQDTYGLAGAWMTESLNESQYTYEVAPVFTLIEQEVLSKLRDLCGYKSGDGIFCPGGSLANMYAINHARYVLNEDYKENGNFSSKPLQIFASDQSHYSLLKGAAFLGIGTNNVIKVETDKSGRMIPESLDRAIANAKSSGAIPLMVVATGGTTVYGAYDPLQDIADICVKYGIWFHVDAAWGGGALLSSTHRHYLDGINRSNSVTWCQHKMMGVPLQCSAFLLNGNETLMNRCMSAKARYLFQQDKFYDISYDTGDKSLQCGRKVDAFRLWLMWKAKGNKGFEVEIDHKFAISRYFTQLLHEREGFEVLMEPQCTNVCFWYIPECLRNEERTPEFWQRLSKVAPAIKEGMVLEGSMLIGYQPNSDQINFFRIIFSNARATKESVAFVIDEIDRLGQAIQV
nr:cysteine sulfinic acid decarboxylase-like [Lytechinus pictus]